MPQKAGGPTTEGEGLVEGAQYVSLLTKRWVIHDIKIGGRSQFSDKMAPVSGAMFSTEALEKRRLRCLDTVQTAMNIEIEVEYIGLDPDGEGFEATIVGIAADR